MKKLRPYQAEIAIQIVEKIKEYKIAYVSAEVRCGKTLMALEACKLLGVKKVLFLTKKKAISSIEEDYADLNYTYKLTVINYESLHKIEHNDFDIVIYDEAHGLSAFPKPAKRAKDIKARFRTYPAIFLTGTPAIESGSQWYHQLWLSDYSPFFEYKNFYKWAADYVKVKQINYGASRPVNDYSKADREAIQDKIKHLLIIFTQKEAGFDTVINEKILHFDLKPMTLQLSKRLINDRVIEGKTDVILADTAVKLQNKVHQILSGTCIGESGDVIFLDDSKAQFIKQKFAGYKLALFYFFRGELTLLQKAFEGEITTDLEEFNTTDKHIAIQQSGSEGMNLSKADYLIFYNFGFSGKNYVQSRDRLTTMERKSNDVYFIFERDGISEKVYKRVREKKDYNNKLFKKDFL